MTETRVRYPTPNAQRRGYGRAFHQQEINTQYRSKLQEHDKQHQDYDLSENTYQGRLNKVMENQNQNQANTDAINYKIRTCLRRQILVTFWEGI